MGSHLLGLLNLLERALLKVILFNAKEQLAFRKANRFRPGDLPEPPSDAYSLPILQDLSSK